MGTTEKILDALLDQNLHNEMMRLKADKANDHLKDIRASLYWIFFLVALTIIAAAWF
jgi:hypothetical protein